MTLPKFIITMDGVFRLGMVNQHKDLLKPGDSCLGGGYYRFDYTSNRIILDRSSYDFGKPKWHLLEVLKVPSAYRGMRLVYYDDDDREINRAALVGEGIRQLRECGFSEEDARVALTPLVTGNVHHALTAGPAKALTGPVERGDITTLQKHLQVLENEDDKKLYRLLSQKLLPLAKEKNPDRSYEELEQFLR